jgi:hypothetical protein
MGWSSIGNRIFFSFVFAFRASLTRLVSITGDPDIVQLRDLIITNGEVDVFFYYLRLLSHLLGGLGETRIETSE